VLHTGFTISETAEIPIMLDPYKVIVTYGVGMSVHQRLVTAGIPVIALLPDADVAQTVELMRSGVAYVLEITSLDEATFAEIIKTLELPGSLYYLRKIMWTSEDVFAWIDADRIIKYINPACNAMFGYPVQAFVGTSIMDWIDRVRLEDSDLPVRIKNFFDSHHTLNVDFQFQDAHGHWLWFRAKGSAADESGIVIQITKIEAQKQHEARIQHEQRRYQALFNNINDAVTLISLNDRYIDINPRTAEMLGVPIEDLIGRHRADFTAPEEYDDSAYRLAKLLETGHLPIYERTFIRADGTPFRAELNVTLVYDEEGEPDYIQSIIRDISERKAAEAKLREREERLRLITENIADMVLLHRTDGKLLWGTPSVERILGYSVEEYIAISGDAQASAELIHPDDLETAWITYEQALSGETVKTYEYRLQHKDGNYRWLETNTIPIKDSSGQVSRLLSVSRDITDRKEANIAYQIQQERYRALFERNNDGVFIIGLDNKLIEVNVAGSAMFKTSVDAIVGIHFEVERFVIPAEHEDARERGKRLQRGESLPTYERTYIDFAGVPFLAEVNTALVQDEAGNPLHIQSIVKDITERKRAENLLREREERLRMVTDNVTDIICLHAPDTAYLYATPSLTKITGYAVEDVLGKPVTDFIVEEDYPIVQRKTQLAVNNRETVEGIIYRIERIDGTYLWLETNVQPIYNDAKKLVMTVSSSRDINERILSQERQLQLAVQKERVNFLARFITEASHEFLTPLSIINSSLYLIGRAKDSDGRQRHIDKIKVQVKGIERLLQDLLTIIRLDSLQSVDITSFNMALLLDDVVAVSRAHPEAADVAIFSHTALHDLPEVNGVPELMQLAFAKLLDNAVHYTSPGDEIHISLEMKDSLVQITIRDTGSGIKAESLPKIFGRFFREDLAHSTPGFGLGLSIAQRAIELHHGEILVESVFGEGSTFTIVLPYLDRLT